MTQHDNVLQTTWSQMQWKHVLEQNQEGANLCLCQFIRAACAHLLVVVVQLDALDCVSHRIVTPGVRVPAQQVLRQKVLPKDCEALVLGVENAVQAHQINQRLHLKSR